MKKKYTLPTYPYGGGPLTAEGAKEILRDGSVHGKPLTEKQKKYFGYIAGGGQPKAQDGYDVPITPIKRINNLPSIYDKVPDYDINSIEQQTSPSYQVGRRQQLPIDYLSLINGAATAVTDVANTARSQKDFRNEQRKYYQELQEPTYNSNYTVNDLPTYTKYGGGEYAVGGENEDRYSVFGKLASTIKDEGWYPSAWNREYTEFSPSYNASGKDVIIDNKPTGSVIVRGNKAGQFDILIRDSSGKQPDHFISKGISADDVHNYFTNKKSTVNQRVDNIKDELTAMKKGGWIKKAISHPGRCKNPGSPECPKGSPQYNLAMRFKHGDLHKAEYGAMEETYGDTPRKYATVEAEGGEVYQDNQGDINKIADNAPRHEQGGVPLANVSRVLEDTSTSRKDDSSKSLRITPTMFKGMFGFDSGKTVSHSQALELADEHYRKQSDKVANKINKSLYTLEDNPDDIYATNSLRFNTQRLKDVPQRDDIFNHLFDHQEQVKQSMGIGQQYESKYGVDNDPYSSSGTKAGRTSTTGLSTLYDIPDGVEGLNRRWKMIAGIDGSNMSNSEFQAKTYDWLLQNRPDLLRQAWSTYGNTSKGISKGIGKNLDFRNLSDTDLSALKDAYVDGKLGARTIVPPSRLGDPEIEKHDLSYHLPVPNGDPSLTVGVPEQGTSTPEIKYNNTPTQHSSRFNEPLRWYDLAGPLMTLGSAERIPAKYNPIQGNEVRLKLQNPEPALRAGQAQYNQATSMLPDNAAGMSNLADLYSAKYANDNQVLGNYENVNSQIKNQEVLYNAGVRDRQSVADAQQRQTFEQQMLQSKEAERQQKLSAFDDIFNRVALNHKLNREGNLLMQMFPNYDQYAQYNGNQRYFTTNTSPGVGQNASPQIQVIEDPQTGQRYRVAYGPDGKMISSSKIFPDNKAIGAKSR